MRFKLALFFSLVSIAAVTGQPADSDAPVTEGGVQGKWTWPDWIPGHHKTSTTTTPSTTTSSTTPSPPPPSPSPNTTTTSTTPSPPPPSPSPNTTTTSTTPSPPPPSPSPNTTTTTPPPTTPPAPTPPAPKKDYGNWTVSETNGTLCIMLQATLTLNVKYPLVNKTQEGSVSISVPNDATANGTCANTTNTLNIYWGENKAEFIFSKMGTTAQYDLENVTVTLVPDKTFVNITKDVTKVELKSSSSHFPTPLSYSYQCSVQKSVALVNATATAPNTTAVAGSLELKKLHLQAFMETKDARFGSPEDCDEDASDIVPIVVGCALAALIVVILGVYVWGRRRSQSRGYLSM